MPKVVDAENHKSEVLIESLLDWISFDNATQTLRFAPGLEDRGQTYYFNITVKEENSDTMKFTYFCRVVVTGEKPTYEDQTSIIRKWRIKF